MILVTLQALPNNASLTRSYGVQARPTLFYNPNALPASRPFPIPLLLPSMTYTEHAQSRHRAGTECFASTKRKHMEQARSRHGTGTEQARSNHGAGLDQERSRHRAGMERFASTKRKHMEQARSRHGAGTEQAQSSHRADTEQAWSVSPRRNTNTRSRVGGFGCVFLDPTPRCYPIGVGRTRS